LSDAESVTHFEFRHFLQSRAVGSGEGEKSIGIWFTPWALIKLDRETRGKIASANHDLSNTRGEIAALKSTIGKLDRELGQMKAKTKPSSKKFWSSNYAASPNLSMSLVHVGYGSKTGRAYLATTGVGFCQLNL
jgi:hypothetical protein